MITIEIFKADDPVVPIGSAVDCQVTSSHREEIYDDVVTRVPVGIDVILKKVKLHGIDSLYFAGDLNERLVNIVVRNDNRPDILFKNCRLYRMHSIWRSEDEYKKMKFACEQIIEEKLRPNKICNDKTEQWLERWERR